MSGVNPISIKKYILFEIYKFQNYILEQIHDKKESCPEGFIMSLEHYSAISYDIINAPESSGASTGFISPDISLLNLCLICHDPRAASVNNLQFSSVSAAHETQIRFYSA